MSTTHNMDMSHQELYFRSLVGLFGLAITVGAFVVEAAILLHILQALGGVIVLLLSTIKRFKLWP